VAKTLKAVGLDFLESAPRRSTVQVHIDHPASAVFAALADDPAGWGKWFPGFSKTGQYVTPAPYGVGSQRKMTMGGLALTETVLAWEQPTRWAYFVDRATMPGIRAFAEEYRIDAVGEDKSTLTWTMAVDLAPFMRPVGPIMSAAAGSMFRKAGKKLNRHLSAAAS
jgi:hypothetical protein